jgi:hypothetical protein
MRKASVAITTNESLTESEDQRRCIREWTKKVQTAARRLRRAVSAVSKGQKTPAIETPPTLRPLHEYKVDHVRFKAVTGWLDASEKFLNKNARDVPLIRAKTGRRSTPAERALIQWELAQIEDAASMLLKGCDA